MRSPLPILREGTGVKAYLRLVALVRDNTLTDKELGGFFEAGIRGRKDHIRFMQVLSRYQRSVLSDDREKILEQAGKSGPVTVRDR